MRSIGLFVKNQCLAYIYPSNDNTFKFRSTQTIDRTCRDGSTEKYVYRSNPYNSIQEAMPFVCRFIKRQYNIDLNALPEGDVELKKVPFSGRVSPTDVPDFLMRKLEVVLSSEGPIAPAEEFDTDEEEEVTPGDLPEAEQDDSLF
jgi:hypothetical protein